MPSDDRTPAVPSPRRVAEVVKRIDDRGEFGTLLDLSDFMANAWPNGRSMDQ